MIKKKLALLIVLIIPFVTTLCLMIKLIYSDAIVEENCEEILNYLGNNDEEKLKKMFCERTAEGGLFELEVDQT